MTIAAPEDSGVSAVAALKAELMAAFEAAGPSSVVVLDLGRVSRADTSLAQLIIASQAEAKARSVRLELRGAEDDLALKALLSCDSLGDGPLQGPGAVAAGKGELP